MVFVCSLGYCRQSYLEQKRAPYIISSPAPSLLFIKLRLLWYYLLFCMSLFNRILYMPALEIEMLGTPISVLNESMLKLNWYDGSMNRMSSLLS